MVLRARDPPLLEVEVRLGVYHEDGGRRLVEDGAAPSSSCSACFPSAPTAPRSRPCPRARGPTPLQRALDGLDAAKSHDGAPVEDAPVAHLFNRLQHAGAAAVRAAVLHRQGPSGHSYIGCMSARQAGTSSRGALALRERLRLWRLGRSYHRAASTGQRRGSRTRQPSRWSRSRRRWHARRGGGAPVEL